VGTGSIGLRHLRLFRELPGVAVEVCDLRTAGLAEARELAPEARQWTDLESALSSPPDIVVVATPPDHHAQAVLSALQAGCHVFCEKPLAGNLEQARIIAAAEKSSGRLLNVGYVQRFLPEIERVRDLISAGLLGDICYTRFEVATLCTLELSRSRHQNAVYGAAALDYAYGFDTFAWILKAHPKAVYACGAKVEGLPLDSDPNVISAVLDYSLPLVGEIHIDYVAHPDRCSYTFQGTEGFLIVDQVRHVLLHGDRSSGQLSQERFPIHRDEVYRRQRDHFLDALSGLHPVSTPAVEALGANLGVDAMLRSLRSGERQSLAAV
jgi:predicted dehydrogenase